MDTLYAVQLDLYKQISNSYANFKEKGATKMTKTTAQARLAGLEDCYSQFKQNHTAILEDLKDLPGDNDYFKTNVSEQILDTFFDRKGEFLQFIEDATRTEREREFAQNPQTRGNQNITSNNTSLEAHSLPKMNLPKFTGKFSEWENFRDLFRSVVHRRTDLDASIKYYHLRTNLSGEAMELIKAIPIAANHYETAWDTLVAYFDNKRRAANTLASIIFGIKPTKQESESELKRVSRNLFGAIESLKKLGRTDSEIGNDLLVYLGVELFDSDTKKEWKRSIDKTSDSPPTVAQLKAFISGQIENLDEGKDASKVKNNKGKTKGENDSNTVHSLQTNAKVPNPKSKCLLCNAEHTLAKCDQMLKKSVADRREIAKQNRVCFNCLGSGHSQNRCKSKYSCFTCKRLHHTLLHLNSADAESNSQKAPSQSDSSTSSQIVNCTSLANHEPVRFLHTTQSLKHTGVLLATALICVQGSNNKQYQVRALIDPCSQICLVTMELCKRLSLIQEDTHTRIHGVGEQDSLLANKLAHLQLKPHFQSLYCLKTKALVIPRISSYKPPFIRSTTSLTYLEGLQLADPNYLDDKQISLLLGADVFSNIIENKLIKGPPSQPMATKSKFGWLLTVQLTMHTCLSDLLQGFWRAEELPTVKNPRFKEDEICEKLFENSTSRDQAGRYTVRLPWKNPDSLDEVKIGSSYSHALSALKLLEVNFLKDERLKTEYSKFIKEYIELGHMSEIDEQPSISSHYFFLPHHGVWKETSTTTKLRVVFNGSGRLNTGESLNDLLYSGPNLLANPVDLICTVRNYKIALSADVEKMFRMIGIDSRDRKFQVILWRFNTSERIRIWILNTVTYDLTCSSYLAIRTLLQMATDHQETHPIAAEVVQKEMYSDNVLTGAHSTAEAVTKVDELVSLFAKAKMNLRKWSTNHHEVLSSLPKNMLEQGKITLFSADSSIPILGIAWHTKGDYFCFHLADLSEAKPATKRNVLSRIARTFDPLGWISPVIVTAKILLQLLWLQKVSWDEPLSEEIAQQWSSWLQQLRAIREIKIPRWTGFTPHTLAELHGFADASKKAYGAVLYLRFVRGSCVTTSLQVAKSKVAPVKTLSIPRLELCASLLLVRLAKQFLDSSKLEISTVHLWTDSADVLFWLRDQPSRWATFIANRCSEIHTSLPDAYWHHVKTKENPADIVSRGIEPSKLQCNQLWWKGPAFLIEKAEPWSKMQDELNFVVNNVVTVNTCTTTAKITKGERKEKIKKENEKIEKEIWSLVGNYSSLNKLLRVTAYCLRFISRTTVNIRVRDNRKGGLFQTPFLEKKLDRSVTEISSCEIDNAELFWCYLVQQAFFRDEYRLLSLQKTLSGKSPLSTLNPFVENCLIRVGGRLANALSDDNAKHPVVLPHSSRLTVLFIQRAHSRTLHGGTQLTLATLRQTVWVVRGRTEVRRVIQACIQCTRYAARIPSQLMGELPSARVQPASPFQKAGVDYAGPVSVRLTKTRGKGTLKAYICIFVCMVTKAVHLELAEDYSSDAFIAAFHRFTARRGHCKELYSDRGTNFVGANSELKAMLHRCSEFQGRISRQLADQGTAWHFNPPSAPHFGGLWEAGVKSLKYHIRRVIGDQILTFSEFSTLLCRVEACLNSRSILRLSDDSSDLEFLTPAHFLIQRASYLVPEPDLTADNLPLGKRWQLLSQMTQKFWNRWSSEYLTALQSRNKWLHPKPAPNLDDLVLIRSENTPPAKWPMGKIVKLHPGDDKKVRIATVKTSSGLFQRPIFKLVFLPNTPL